ncbi:MAG TPA: hypothetical protein DEO88_01100 [Syntrophobacteraceae bacterium]|nr:hypothetical protein [Syntrophobacteraceae bacterium]
MFIILQALLRESIVLAVHRPAGAIVEPSRPRQAIQPRQVAMDAATYKDFIFGLLFLKRRSDVF